MDAKFFFTREEISIFSYIIILLLFFSTRLNQTIKIIWAHRTISSKQVQVTVEVTFVPFLNVP